MFYPNGYRYTLGGDFSVLCRISLKTVDCVANFACADRGTGRSVIAQLFTCGRQYRNREVYRGLSCAAPKFKQIIARGDDVCRSSCRATAMFTYLKIPRRQCLLSFIYHNAYGAVKMIFLNDRSPDNTDEKYISPGRKYSAPRISLYSTVRTAQRY